MERKHDCNRKRDNTDDAATVSNNVKMQGRRNFDSEK